MSRVDDRRTALPFLDILGFLILAAGGFTVRYGNNALEGVIGCVISVLGLLLLWNNRRIANSLTQSDR